MKKKAIILILTLALVLCPIFAACGKNTEGATPDETSASQKGQSMPASYVPYAASSAAAASAAAAADAENKDDQQDERGQNDQQSQNAQQDQNDKEEQNDQQEQKDNQDENPTPQKDKDNQDKSSSGGSSSGVAEPIYSEDDKPSFTIAVTNKDTNKAYSASCGYMTDEKKAGGVNFFLPGGEYHIAIYPYDDGKTMGAPLMTKEYRVNCKADEKKTIRIVYNIDPKAIEVEEVKSDRNQ